MTEERILTVPYEKGHEIDAIATMRDSLPDGWQWKPFLGSDHNHNPVNIESVTSEGFHLIQNYDIRRDKATRWVSALIEPCLPNPKLNAD